MQDEIILKLSTAEVSLIVQALGDRPFKEVYELIGKINEQVNQQPQNGNFNPRLS